jgi:hypothetical protein
MTGSLIDEATDPFTKQVELIAGTMTLKLITQKNRTLIPYCALVKLRPT